MEPFSYSHELAISYKAYTQIWNMKLGKRKTSGSLRWAVKLGILLLLAIACLFWAYTFLLGICLLVLFLIALFFPRLLPKGLRSTYFTNPFLQNEMTYAVDNDGLYVKGADIQAQCAWSLLGTWQIRGDWLILQPQGIPTLYFSRAALRRGGIYETVMALCKEHGHEYK